MPDNEPTNALPDFSQHEIVHNSADPVSIVQAIKDALSQDPTLRKELERAIFSPAELDIVHNRDSHLPNSPYYKRHYALSLKPTIDAMITDGENRIIRYKSFPKHSRRTVQLMIYQAYKYLQLEMDTDGRYGRFRDEMEIQNKTDGVHLVLVKNITKHDLPFHEAAEVLLPVKERNLWREALDRFISEPWTPQLTKDQCSLQIDKLNLTADEMEQAELMLQGLIGIFGKVTEASIKCIKTDPSQQT